MKAKVRLIFYTEDLVSIGSVKLTALRVIGERFFDEPVELGDKPEEALEKIALELGEGSYVEAIAETKNQVIRIGMSRASSKQGMARHAIFYRPSKLLRVGIIEDIKGDGQGGSAASIFGGYIGGGSDQEGMVAEEIQGMDQGFQAREPGEISNIAWYSPQGELYVFEGDLRVDGSCEAIVVVTEHGERIYFLRGFEGEKPAIVRRVRRVAKKRRRSRKRAKGS